MAYLQVLEGNKKHQNETWSEIFDQNLSSIEALKRIMIGINREVYMNFLEQIRQEAIEEVRPILLEEGEKRGEKRGIRLGEKIGEKRGKKVGKLEGMKNLLLLTVETFAPELLPVYKAQVLSAQTIEAFLSLKDKIYRDMGSLR